MIDVTWLDGDEFRSANFEEESEGRELLESLLALDLTYCAVCTGGRTG